MELVKLSRQKGFMSRDKLHVVKKDYYFLWMCELQEWLRDVYNIDVFVYPYGKNYGHCVQNNNETIIEIITKFTIVGIETFTYTQTLEQGLLKALKNL